MLVDAFGIRNFARGIRNYLVRYQFRNTESRDLFEILRDNTRGSVDIVEFANRWMKFPGFPVVNARYDNGVLELSQRRFAMNEKLLGSETWDIPIKYITSRKEDGVILNWFPANFSCAELSVEKPVDWIKLNHGSVGYYVVNYTVEAWSAFRDLLSRNYQTLNPIDRADLLHDAFLLARSGDLCYCTAMNLSSYLVNETAYQPWAVAAEWLVQADRSLYATNVHARFQRYARSLVDRIYREVGWHVGHRDSLVNRELRALILNAACSVGHEHCLKLAGRKLRKFLANTDSPPSDVRSTVYSFGLVTQLDDVGSIFENMSRLHTNEIDPQEKERLMVGLAGVRDKKILNRYLEESMNEKFVRKQNFCELLIRIALNPAGVDVVWDFVRSNWNSLEKKYPANDYSMGRAIVTIVSLFKDEIKLKEAKEFFKRYPNVGISENARRSAIEEIENNISWLRANVNKINRWLRVNGFDRIAR